MESQNHRTVEIAKQLWFIWSNPRAQEQSTRAGYHHRITEWLVLEGILRIIKF